VADEPTSSPEELKIELVSSDDHDLPEGEDPAEREGERLLPLGRPGEDACRLLTYPCLKQVLAHGQRHTEQEIGGVLLGKIWRCPRGRVTEARECLPAEHTEAGLGHVTFSHETWQGIYAYLEQNASELRIVGWYHSHPGFGAFFSAQDRFIQQNFFAGAGQFGVVVDPIREELAIFETLAEEVVELGGLWVSSEEETAAAARQLLARLSLPVAGPVSKGLMERLVERIKGESSSDK
jgi:proteasome lid subunit RPN8/RPN11